MFGSCDGNKIGKIKKYIAWVWRELTLKVRGLQNKFISSQKSSWITKIDDLT